MHHREVHRAGDERAWWKATGIDPLKVADKFWKERRGDRQDAFAHGRCRSALPGFSGTCRSRIGRRRSNLLAGGADANAHLLSGETPLMEAARRGNLATVRVRL
jgi:hypothetical protein